MSSDVVGYWILSLLYQLKIIEFVTKQAFRNNNYAKNKYEFKIKVTALLHCLHTEILFNYSLTFTLNSISVGIVATYHYGDNLNTYSMEY